MVCWGASCPPEMAVAGAANSARGQTLATLERRGDLVMMAKRQVSRREFLRSTGAVGVGILGATAGLLSSAVAAPAVAAKKQFGTPRPDLLDKDSPPGMEVIQLTTEPDVPASHLYMEAQIFTPDSKRFVLHRSAHAHGGSKKDPQHQYLLCDIEDGCRLHPLTDELGATAPSVSPDGKFLYYFVDETEPGGGRLTLKRVGSGRHRAGDDPGGRRAACRAHVPPQRDLPALDHLLRRPAAGDLRVPGRRHDRRVALRADGVRSGEGVGRARSPRADLVQHAPAVLPLARSRAEHDILIQENHGNVADARRSDHAAGRRRRGGHPRHPRRRHRTSATCPGVATATSPARATSAGAVEATGPSPAPRRKRRPRLN